ncbi:MAG: universal stress protein [Saprospiraceae bacterium]|nr:universal stress protein [Bacteroidia bacterium]NNL91017.1 universal stress protein [Saprospiraceae bacterium]
MNAIKLYGKQNSSYEYIKMMIKRFAKKSNIDFAIQEEHDPENFVKDEISIIPAVKIGSDTFYYRSDDNINSFIKTVNKNIISRFKLGPFKHFLVPIDYSDTSLNSVDYALSLAKETGAIVTIIHCYTPHASDLPVMDYQDMMANNKELFESIVEVFESEHKVKDVNAPIINTEFVVGFAGDTIIERAKELNATIVMGTTGAGNALKKIFGSVSAKVINQSEQPIIIVPSDGVFEGLNEVAYATDDLEVDTKAMPQVIDLVKCSYPRINLVHIYKPGDNKIDFDLFEIYKTNYPKSLVKKNNIENENIADGLNNFVTSNEIDLLVMTHIKKNVLEKIFKKSQSQEVAITSTTPVLILHQAR